MSSDKLLQVKTNSRGDQYMLHLFCTYPMIKKIESGEPELKNIGEKYKDKNELVLHNTIIYTKKLNISAMIQEVWLPIPVQLENSTWTNFCTYSKG